MEEKAQGPLQPPSPWRLELPLQPCNIPLSQWNIAWLVLTLTKKGKRSVIYGIVIYSNKIKICLSIEIVRWLYHSLS